MNEISDFIKIWQSSSGQYTNFANLSGHDLIGDGMKLDPVILDRHKSESEMLQFYMGKNTPDRQKFIIDNLKVEMDLLHEEEVA